MHILRKQGKSDNDIAVVELRKIEHLGGAGFDKRALSLLQGTFQDADYSFRDVTRYSLTYMDTDGRQEGSQKLLEALSGHRLVLTLGAEAMKLLCRTRKTLEKFTGSLTWNPQLNLWVLPSYHPSVIYVGPKETINKRYEEFDVLFDHIHRAVDLLTGKLPMPDPEKQSDPCPRIFVGHNGGQNDEKSWTGYWEATEDEILKAIDRFDKWINQASNAEKPVVFSLDTEGRSTNPYQRNSLTMVQVYDGKEAWAFNAGVVLSPEVLPRVQEFLHHRNARFILHNTQFDRQMIRHALAVNLGDRDVDTMCLALGTTEKGKQVGLKYLSRQYLNAPFYEEALDEWLDKENVDYSAIPPDVLANYGNLDVYYTYHLMPILSKKVANQGTGKSVRELLLPAQRVFADLCYRGIKVNLGIASRTSEEWGPIIDQAITKVQEYAKEAGFPKKDTIVAGQAYKTVCECVPVRGHFHLEGVRVTSFRKILREAGIVMPDCTECVNKRYVTKYDATLNVNSSAQMQHLCFDILRMKELPHDGRTTNKAFWKYNANHPLAKLVAEYKELLYLRRNFLEGIKTHVKEDGRVHPNFLLFGTTTGRLSVRDPAMQTIPKHSKNAKAVRKMFQPDDSESVIIDVDYKSLEMFMAHHLTKDPVLLEVLLGEWDAHTALAAKIYRKAPEDITPQERQSVKPVNFGAGYGISGFKLSMDPAMELATGGSPDKAQEFLDEFWNMYSVWYDKCEEWKATALEDQYLMTEMGRRRRWNLITGENANKVKNQAMNFSGQSMASDLCLSSLIRIHKMLPAAWGRPLLSVHDSIVYSIKKAHVHDAVAMIREVMTTAPFETDTPFDVDVEIGLDYGDKEPYDPERDYTNGNM